MGQHMVNMMLDSHTGGADHRSLSTPDLRDFHTSSRKMLDATSFKDESEDQPLISLQDDFPEDERLANEEATQSRVPDPVRVGLEVAHAKVRFEEPLKKGGRRANRDVIPKETQMPSETPDSPQSVHSDHADGLDEDSDEDHPKMSMKSMMYSLDSEEDVVSDGDLYAQIERYLSEDRRKGEDNAKMLRGI